MRMQKLLGGADGLLQERPLSGPMPWVIGIMMFLSGLAAVAALSLGGLASKLEGSDQLTIQIVEAVEGEREAQAKALRTNLGRSEAVRNVRRVEQEELRRLLQPWLGEAALEGEIPIPAMIELELAPGADESLVRRQILQAAPSARLDRNDSWLGPLAKLIASLRWLAAALVLLMGAATAAIVVLAVRGALNTHRETIEVMHLMGATDTQVARMFQRRMAIDALAGGIAGICAALLVLWLLGERLTALGSDLLGGTSIPPEGWIVLALLPIIAALLAIAVARATILRALVRLL